VLHLQSRQMATTTVAPPKKSSKGSTLRWAAALGIVLLLAIAAIFVWGYSVALRELPQVDGTISLSGISAPVSVVRDKLGLPHIHAESYDDLFFAQGFITAQDRLWQMDVNRRYAAGTLAEILGPSLLRHDRRQRYLQIGEACQRAAAALKPQERHLLEIYARGVNAFIEQSRERLPLEFKLLHYAPALWRIEDSLLIGANMDQMLNTQ